MFLEINDISTGSVVVEPLNMLAVNYVYSKEEDNKYRLYYILTNGLIKIEEFGTQADANARLNEIKDLSIGGTNVYTYKGSCEFDELPTSGQEVGDVWNIEDDFDLDGKHYPAGTNVAWDGTGWDALSGNIDLSAYASKEYLVEDEYLRFVGIKYADSYPKESIDLSALTKTGIYFLNGYNSGANHNYPISIKLRGIANITTSQPTGCQGIGILYLYKTYADAENNEYFARMYGTGWDGTGLKNVVCEIKKSSSNGSGVVVDTTPDYNFIIRGTTLTSDSQTISGEKTFNTLPKSSGTPTQNTQLVNKKYVDDNCITFKAFTNDFPTTGTTSDFLDAIEALNLPEGNVYLGEVTFSDLPTGIANAEIEVYIYANNVIWCMLRSSNVSPYLWMCNSHTYRGWEPISQGGSGSQEIYDGYALAETIETVADVFTLSGKSKGLYMFSAPVKVIWDETHISAIESGAQYEEESVVKSGYLWIPADVTSSISDGQIIAYGLPYADFDATNDIISVPNLVSYSQHRIVKTSSMPANMLGLVILNEDRYDVPTVDGMYKKLSVPEYSGISEYAVGDYVLHEGQIYCCNTAIASGGEVWNSAHWTAETYDHYVRDKGFYPYKQDLRLGSGSYLHLETLDPGVYNVIDCYTITEFANPTSNQRLNINDYGLSLHSFTLTMLKPISEVTVSDEVFATLSGYVMDYTGLCYQYAELKSSLNTQAKFTFSGYWTSAAIINKPATLGTTQTFSAVKTFEKYPEIASYSTAVPSTARQFATKQYVDTKLAAAYDTTATYDLGDYVYYNNKLYVCSTAITVAEAWNASHWTEIAPDALNIMKNYVDSQVGTINTALANLATPPQS